MTIARSKKPAVFLTIIIFLMVGGAAAFIYVINNTADPVVEADIDAHFAALEYSDAAEMPSFPEDPSIAEPDVLLFSNNGDAPKTQKGIKSQHSKNRIHRSRTHHSNGSDARPKSKNGITKIATGTWLIEETTFRHARENIRRYVGSARAELAENENGPIGFRLKNIKKKSYLRDIGLRGNDVLVAINGHPLNSVENVTLAIASFQKATRFRLDLLRNDKKRSLYYKIVKD